MDKVYWVETEDAQCKHFKSQEGAEAWAKEWVAFYAKETGMTIEEVEEQGLYYIYSEPMGN